MSLCPYNPLFYLLAVNKTKEEEISFSESFLLQYEKQIFKFIHDCSAQWDTQEKRRGTSCYNDKLQMPLYIIFLE